MPLENPLAERRRLIAMIRLLSRTRRFRYRTIATAAGRVGATSPRPRSG